MEEEGVGGDEGDSETPRDTTARKTVDTHFHTTRHPRCWIPCGVWQVGATTSSRDRVVGNTYDRIFMQYTVSRNGWTSLMKRSSPKDWFGATHAGKFARPACEHGQHIAHAVASTHVVRKTWRHSGRSTVRRLPDHTIPRRRRFWNGHLPWNGRRHRPQTRGRTPWLQERVPTRRYLHKREWPNWLDVCRTVMLGYNASAPEERSRKQVAIMDLVRQHLRLPENPRSRRQATRTNHDKQHTTDPPPDHCNTTTVVRGAMETTKDGEESVSDETEQQDTTAHQPERILTASDIYKTRRVETLCTLQATGRAAALLTAAEAEPVVFSPELVQSLDDLYPQEDTSLYPEPAVSAPLVTFDSKDVAKIIGSRLTRGAAPGLDGWTRELLYPLTKDKALLMEISAILTDMANGNVAPEVAHRLRATNLTVLRKPNKKFRPDRRRVCMGKSHITHGGGRGHASPQNLL
ncbi:hypothetical protein TcBrA4_0007740 [Trypanosoma cruzi]|nr:hypothetical protein TcBrA4_0007740 [Trypanosoma cruzi]